MKISLFFFFLYSFLVVHAQNDELIKQALSDKSNFEIMSWLEENHKMPKKFFVFDTTTSWRPERFFVKGLDIHGKRNPADEHHPYHHSYLFRDSLLDKTFPPVERKALLNKASLLQSRKIQLTTPIAQTVSSFRKIKPGSFILWVSEPVYSTDSAYAFIDFTILEKGTRDKQMEESYHSTVCVVYRKENGGWRKWKLMNYIIL